jgi:alpha-galactosidase/6-phospho-beta-glucosidase family protein
MPKKITIIGGGSSIFTPQLMRLFIGSAVLTGSTITLMDIDPHRLEIMATLAKGLIAHAGSNLKVESTTNQREALVGTDFVIIAIAAGGFDAWEKDIEIPGRYGVFMEYGDSIGPGGMMRAFRHIPILVSVGKDLEEVSPNAWILNYTNPLTANCMAIAQHTSIKTIGLCTCSWIPRNAKFLAGLLGVAAEELVLPAPAAGLNHCAGITQLQLRDGRDALALLQAHTAEPVLKWSLEHFHILPYCWSHWTEFYPAMCQLEGPYQGKAQGLKLNYGLAIYTMEKERVPGRMWADMAERYARGEIELSVETLPDTQAIDVVELMEALLTNRNSIHIVNVPNRGAIANLPDNAVVEVSAVVGRYGVQPLQTGALPEPFAATLRQWSTVQQLTVDAALSGDRRLALDAFLQDPHVAARLSIDAAKALLDELLAAHAAYLPQFQ